ncbi:hypothetical protein [Vibrio sp. WXL103]|uniref:hypothetical protein n=1 Tax=Vibrio sp. WXL103 TaxID=3450710 RepID=UPI003EC71C7D
MREQWERLTKRAQHYFDQQEYAHAITLNREALNYARLGFSNCFARSPQDATAMVLISYLNLIDNYEAADNRMTCERLFEQAFDFFATLEPDNDADYHRGSVMQALNIWQRSRGEYLSRVCLM